MQIPLFKHVEPVGGMSPHTAHFPPGAQEVHANDCDIQVVGDGDEDGQNNGHDPYCGVDSIVYPDSDDE